MDRQLTKEEFRCLTFQLPLNAQCFYLYLLEQLILKWASCLNVSLTLSSTYFIWLFTLWFDNTRQMTLRTDTSSDFASRTICWTLIIFVSFHGTEIRKGACLLFHWAIAHHTNDFLNRIALNICLSVWSKFEPSCLETSQEQEKSVSVTWLGALLQTAPVYCAL